MCTFRASCCCACLSWAHLLAFTGSSVWDRERKGDEGGGGGGPLTLAGRPYSTFPHEQGLFYMHFPTDVAALIMLPLLHQLWGTGIRLLSY